MTVVPSNEAAAVVIVVVKVVVSENSVGAKGPRTLTLGLTATGYHPAQLREPIAHQVPSWSATH